MREYKFRMWDNELNEWFGANNENSPTWYGFHIFGECTRFSMPCLNKMDHLEIEQFTGLKDKNGVEIYEGDIVQFNKKAFEVKYKNDKYYVGFVATMDDDCGSYVHIWYDGIEVIGNIHDNPELL